MSRLSFFSLVVGLNALMMLFPAHAVRVGGLYQAMAPVDSQAPADRAAALREILRNIVIKVSGQNVVPENFAATTRIENLTEQFGYENREAEGKRRLYLWAKLNERGVVGLMREAGMPIWPVERPTTLVWMGVEDGGEQILAEDTDSQVMKEIKAVAERRGLPLVFPLMDLSESSQVDYERVSRLDPAALWSVSQKYGSQYLLLGSLQRVDKRHWRARWRVLETRALSELQNPGLGGQSVQPVPASVAAELANAPVITTPTGPLPDVLASAVDPLATRIAGQFASFASRDGVQAIDITIDDVNGVEDYARSLKYLASLSPVTKVEVIGVNGGEVHYRLHTSADMASLLQIIGLGRVLYDRQAIDRLVFGLNPK